MTERQQNSGRTRRSVIETAGAAAGAAGLAGLAGCLGGGGGGGGNGGGGSNKPLEVMHGWTGGDGADAIKATKKAFKNEYPDMKTDFRPIGGGGNTSLNALVSKRLGNNNPPSSFANWPGKNFFRYEGALADIEKDVWEDAGLKDAFVDPAENACKWNGGYSAVPIGSHRLNNLFYNKSVVKEAGVDPATLKSPKDLIDAMDKVQSNTDKAGMAHAMKAPWTTLQLISAVLLGQGGYNNYMTFVNGKGGKSALRSALQTTKTMLEGYITGDAGSIGFTTAIGKIADGKAAFMHQGNWAAGAFSGVEGFDYGKDWGFVPFPGSQGQYHFHLDAFLVPSNNPTPNKTNKWMKFVGSKTAQKKFNPRKGSISMRKDVGTDAFGPFLTETIKDFKNAKNLPPTLAHGLAVKPDKLTSLKDATSKNFTGPYKVEQATSKFLEIV